MQAGADTAFAIVVTLGVVLAVIVLPAYLFVRSINTWVDQKLDRLRVERRLPSRRPARRGLGVWVALLMVMGFILVLSQFTPTDAGAPARPRGHLPLFFGGLIFSGLVGWHLFHWARNRDPVLAEAATLVAAGDSDGAIRLLAEAMEQCPTASRANQLGVLCLGKHDWSGASKWLHEAEVLGLAGWVLRNNLCVALRGLGRLDDALDLIRPRAEDPRATLVEVVNYAHVLIELGRLDTAWDQIRRAEDQLATRRTGIPGAEKTLREMLDGCRNEYEKHVAAMKNGPAPTLDEFA